MHKNILSLLFAATILGETTLPLESKAVEDAHVVAGFKSSSKPCAHLEGNLSMEQKRKWSVEIARQLKVRSVEIMKLFNSGGWSIVQVNPWEADEAFLFYNKSPLTSHYITLWSGAATLDERKNIRDWTLHNVKDIPNQLADCFARYVTNE